MTSLLLSLLLPKGGAPLTPGYRALALTGLLKEYIIVVR